MLDIKFIRDNQEQVRKAIKDRGIVLNLDELLELDEQRRKLIHELDEDRALRKEVAEKREVEKGKKIKEKINRLEDQLGQLEVNYNELMLLVPNIPSEDTPVGGEEAYKEIKKWGEPPKFDFQIRDHIEIGKSLDILDLERGAKVSGFRGYFLKNEGALLQLGVLNLAMQKIIKAGFTPMIPPTMVREFALVGSGHFPGDRQEIYQIEEYTPSPHPLPPGERDKGRGGEVKFLTGTAEPSLLAYHADETLNAKDLPVKLCGISPCYRREVGGYGKDTKGIYRVHEFMKVEQVVFCQNDLQESEKWFEAMLRISEEFLQDLELPYRVVAISTRDMGAGKYKMYDIETWMPGRNAYGETHSCSNLTDWQARRLNIRYREGGELKYVHTLNNTMIASPRTLIAILENNQRKDGSVEIPKVLQDFVGKKKIEPK